RPGPRARPSGPPIVRAETSSPSCATGPVPRGPPGPPWALPASRAHDSWPVRARMCAVVMGMRRGVGGRGRPVAEPDMPPRSEVDGAAFEPRRSVRMAAPALGLGLGLGLAIFAFYFLVYRARHYPLPVGFDAPWYLWRAETVAAAAAALARRVEGRPGWTAAVVLMVAAGVSHWIFLGLLGAILALTAALAIPESRRQLGSGVPLGQTESGLVASAFAAAAATMAV